ncbi:HtaA domain-containing protein [Streptomyces sp. BR123]|uniref:HtaA domain-containing protein n=1 Tax=Streptomyces sp. BR123 TaxID=2749828 RepID=UPI0015C492D4|nr:HtaA domain-containing protein [Streptomyces sp. BR123]NXY96879.1 HtaA domain-containing protein [Streptomyces sp. BR123]
MSSSTPRRSVSLVAAVLTAAALGATVLALPATAVGAAPAAALGPAPAAETLKIVNGTLDWGVLARYRAYVTDRAKGTITPADGAAANADGTFRFTSATGEYDKNGSHVATAAFKGSVTFESTAHRFKVTLANLRIDTGTKRLTADVTKNGTLTRDVPLAEVAFSGSAMDRLATTLTKEAADQLGYDDYAGMAGDPLTADLTYGDSTPPSPSPSAPSPSGSTAPSPSPSNGGPAPTLAPSPGASSPAPSGPQQLLGGRLTWGVKESFRTYVVKGGGSVAPSGGAMAAGNTFSFAFGKGELDAAEQKLNASFAGSLRFRQPDHEIDMTFTNLRVNAEGRKGTLLLDIKTPEATKADIPFATLDLSKAEYRTTGGVLTLASVPAAFTAEGSAAIGNWNAAYEAGKPTDPVTLSVTVDKDAVLPGSTPTTGRTGGTTTGGTTSTGTTGAGSTVGGGTGGSTGGTLAATGAGVPAGALLATSGVAVVAGAGALSLARRRRTARS